jgi:hypothetical protein
MALGGTAAAANAILAMQLLTSPVTTVSKLHELSEDRAPIMVKQSSLSPLLDERLPSDASTVLPAAAADLIRADEQPRETSDPERIIGELRSWSLLSANWDSEGANAPSEVSLRQAVAFVRRLTKEQRLPDPMLLSSGHAGLSWDDANLVADLEFLPDGRITYYIERNGDKHKGVLQFDRTELPPVLAHLVRA